MSRAARDSQELLLEITLVRIFCKNILENTLDYLAERLENGLSHFGPHVGPVFVQEEVRVVAERLIAVVQVVQFEMDLRYRKRQFYIRRLQILLAVPRNRSSSKFDRRVRVTCEWDQRGRLRRFVRIFRTTCLLIEMLLSPTPWIGKMRMFPLILYFPTSLSVGPFSRISYLPSIFSWNPLQRRAVATMDYSFPNKCLGTHDIL